ncbi:MAG TPA: hypothetical protein VM487_02405 [Phycisphaerae bacterium]|nr:hypothetical protein [Phycisphaerae bacterium]
MSKRSKRRSTGAAQPAEPVDVVDGIPDCAARRPAWKYVLIALVFLAWAAFLLYCHLAGRLENHPHVPP